MIKAIQEFFLRQAYQTVSDFLEYINWEGECVMGFTNDLGQSIDDCITVLDDEGHAIFIVFPDLDDGTFSGNMCAMNTAPGTHEDFREKYSKRGDSPIAILRWGLGI